MTPAVPLPDARIVRRAGPAVAAAAVALYWRESSSAFRKRRKVGRRYELSGPVSPSEEQFMTVAEALTDAPVTRGNEVDVLFNGDEIFPKLLETIRSADQTLCLLNYVTGRATSPGRSPTRSVSVLARVSTAAS